MVICTASNAIVFYSTYFNFAAVLLGQFYLTICTNRTAGNDFALQGCNIRAIGCYSAINIGNSIIQGIQFGCAGNVGNLKLIASNFMAITVNIFHGYGAICLNAVLSILNMHICSLGNVNYFSFTIVGDIGKVYIN